MVDLLFNDSEDALYNNNRKFLIQNKWVLKTGKIVFRRQTGSI